VLTVINDTHVGTVRSAGTTPESQLALREHNIQALKALMPESGDMMILGDLFDTYNVPMLDLLNAFKVLNTWLQTGSGTLYLVAGNHDLSKTTSVLSSFQFLAKLLKGMFSKVVVIEDATMTPYGYVIPHLRNQDLFNHELSKVPEVDNLFLHCNYANNFAVQSDQSLNLSREVAEKLPVKNIILAHEHHQRVELNGKVTVIGNQIAMSVSDWLANGNKHFLQVTGSTLTRQLAASRSVEFAEVQWDVPVESSAKFIRMVGTASAEQASAVLSAINKYRAASKALVITNGVNVTSDDSSEVFANALQNTQNLSQSFSVLNAVKELLTADEYAVVEKFL
jgi:hypothetical protein